MNLLAELGGRTGAYTSAAKSSNMVCSTCWCITMSRHLALSSKLGMSLRNLGILYFQGVLLHTLIVLN